MDLKEGMAPGLNLEYPQHKPGTPFIMIVTVLQSASSWDKDHTVVQEKARNGYKNPQMPFTRKQSWGCRFWIIHLCYYGDLYISASNQTQAISLCGGYQGSCDIYVRKPKTQGASWFLFISRQHKYPKQQPKGKQCFEHQAKKQTGTLYGKASRTLNQSQGIYHKEVSAAKAWGRELGSLIPHHPELTPSPTNISCLRHSRLVMRLLFKISVQ